MDHLRRVVIGLGSNVGDRAAHISTAIEGLKAEPDIRVVKVSPLYQSPPAGGPPQGDYLNAAVVIITALEGRALLDRALGIEQQLGRRRAEEVRWGPRTIDLDILWIEGEWVDEPGLVVPHRHLGDRPFAVRPLLDVAPDASDPRTGEAFSGMPAASAPLDLYEP